MKWREKDLHEDIREWDVTFVTCSLTLFCSPLLFSPLLFFFRLFIILHSLLAGGTFKSLSYSSLQFSQLLFSQLFSSSFSFETWNLTKKSCLSFLQLPQDSCLKLFCTCILLIFLGEFLRQKKQLVFPIDIQVSFCESLFNYTIRLCLEYIQRSKQSSSPSLPHLSRDPGRESKMNTHLFLFDECDEEKESRWLLSGTFMCKLLIFFFVGQGEK